MENLKGLWSMQQVREGWMISSRGGVASGQKVTTVGRGGEGLAAVATGTRTLTVNI